MMLSFRRTDYYLVLLLGIFLSYGCGEDRRSRPIPIEEFFSKPEKSNFQIGPDGEHISFLQSHKGKQNIFLMDTGEESATSITELEDKDIQNYFWANDNELVFHKERVTGDSLELFIVDRRTKKVRSLIPPSDMRLRWLSGKKLTQDYLYMALNSRDKSVFDVYRLDIRNSKLEMIAQNPGNVSKWFLDHHGNVRLAIASDGINETMLYRSSGEGEFEKVITNNFQTTIKPLTFVKGKENHIYALTNMNRDKQVLVEMDMSTGKEVNVVYSHPDVDLSDVVFSKKEEEISYVSYDLDKPQRKIFSKNVQAILEDVEQKLDSYSVRIIDKDTSDNKYIIRSYADNDPGSYYFYDNANKALRKLADVNTTLSKETLCSMTPITYKSRDGLEIHGYLTFPQGKNKQKLPLIVIPHNGPAGRNVWGYNSEVQFLANRGYAVFQMNYRGSTGYGKRFWTEGFNEWGGKIQNDIEDGVRHLIKEKIADPRRIGIYGFSFGGYSALYGACFHGDLYASAVSYSGITNLFTYLKEIPPYYKQFLQMYYETIGDPVTNAAYFKRASPIFHSNKVNIPLFIAQGGKDERSNVNETNQFVLELKARNAPITYMLKEDEGHFFSKEQNRIAFYRKLETFFYETVYTK